MLLHDVRLAVRGLARRPAFAVTAILLLALGSGANAAVFSVVRGVLLRPLPFRAPDRLVAVWPGQYVSNEEIGFWRSRASALSEVAGIATGWLMALGADGGEPLKVTGNRVSDNYFQVLGVTAAVGRAIAPGDGVVGRERVVVLSDCVWRRRFGADPSTIGRSVLVDQVAHEVIGVMPAGFEVLGEQADLWVPLPFGPGTPALQTTMSLALARLRDGVTVNAASRELARLAPDLRRALGKPDDWGRTIHAASRHDTTTSAVRPALTLLIAAVGLVLLLGAANLGTLVLGRSIERARELAVRIAVGASPRRLVRQLLIEQAVLAAAGAVAGLALARLTLPALIRRLLPEVPRQADIALDVTVFATVLVVAVGLAVAMALLPAVEAMRIPLVAGRRFTAADQTASAPVALVNTTLARTLFGAPQAALGQRLVQVGGARGGQTTVEVVGVIGDVRHDGLDTPPRPEFYRPLTQTFMFPMHLVVRTAGEPSALAGAVRRAAYDVDPAVPVADVQTMRALLAGTLGRPRLLATLLGVFAAAGVLLSIVGLHGAAAAVHCRRRAGLLAAGAAGGTRRSAAGAARRLSRAIGT
jgi:hypothetical protein